MIFSNKYNPPPSTSFVLVYYTLIHLLLYFFPTSTFCSYLQSSYFTSLFTALFCCFVRFRPSLLFFFSFHILPYSAHHSLSILVQLFFPVFTSFSPLANSSFETYHTQPLVILPIYFLIFFPRPFLSAQVRPVVLLIYEALYDAYISMLANENRSPMKEYPKYIYGQL